MPSAKTVAQKPFGSFRPLSSLGQAAVAEGLERVQGAGAREDGRRVGGQQERQQGEERG